LTSFGAFPVDKFAKAPQWTLAGDNLLGPGAPVNNCRWASAQGPKNERII